MATETNLLGAKLILEWNDGEWYISSFTDTSGNNIDGLPNIGTSAGVTNADTSVKLPEWQLTYKYQKNNIVAWEGKLYVSNQDNNERNTPSPDESFWWSNMLDFRGIDALTLQGRTVKALKAEFLGGVSITDFYTKGEIENLFGEWFSNINASRLANKTISDIEADRNTAIATSKTQTIDYIKTYLVDDSAGSFTNQLIAHFNSLLLPDSTNK